MKRFLWLCLAVTMLAALFAGCGDSGTQQETSAPAQTTTAAPETDAPETDAPVDLQGYEFVLYHADIHPTEGQNEMHDRWIAEIHEIETRLNCTYNFNVSGENGMEAIIPAVMSEINLGDFVLVRHADFFPLSRKNFLKPLDGDELIQAGLDVTDSSRWDQIYTSMSQFDGNIWAILMNGEYENCIFGDMLAFNEAITSQAGYDRETLYDLVRKGEWTYDVFLDITAKVTKDLDGDGAFDQWGMGNGVFQYAEMCVTNGYQPIYMDGNGKITADFTDPRYIEALEFVGQLGSTARRPDLDFSAAKDCRVLFAEGKLAFNQFYGPNFFAEPLILAEFDFGILPNPKGPQQEDYICVYPDLDGYVMLSCNKNVETSVLLMNELGTIMTDDGWKDNVKKAFRDDESWDIFETYIYPNTTLNSQNITGEAWQHIRENIVQEVLLGNKTAAQAVEGQNAVVQAMIDATYGQ